MKNKAGTAYSSVYEVGRLRTAVTNMFIHGGSFPGSAGCIDIMSNDLKFFRALSNYKNTTIPVIVKYK